MERLSYGVEVMALANEACNLDGYGDGGGGELGSD